MTPLSKSSNPEFKQPKLIWCYVIELFNAKDYTEKLRRKIQVNGPTW